MFSPNRSLLDPVDLSLSLSLALFLSLSLLVNFGPSSLALTVLSSNCICWGRGTTSPPADSMNFTYEAGKTCTLWCPLWVVESSEVKHDTNMGEHRWTPLNSCLAIGVAAEHPGSTRVKVQCQRHQTRQQHGAVGRENMPITGLPWQLQIIWVTRICRMGSSMSGCFCASFRAAPSAMHDNLAKYPIKACQDCNNLEELHQRSRTSKCTARSWWDVPFRSVQYVQSAALLFHCFHCSRPIRPFSVQCQEDLWMITSRCLGVWACTHACLCVCMCVFVLAYMLRLNSGFGVCWRSDKQAWYRTLNAGATKSDLSASWIALRVNLMAGCCWPKTTKLVYVKMIKTTSNILTNTDHDMYIYI